MRVLYVQADDDEQSGWLSELPSWILLVVS